MKYKVVPLKDPVGSLALFCVLPSFIKFVIFWIESSFEGTTRAKEKPKTYVVRYKRLIEEGTNKKGK